MKVSKTKMIAAAFTAPLLAVPAHAGWWCEAQCAAARVADEFSCSIARDGLVAGCIMQWGSGNQGNIDCMADAADFYDTCISIADSDAATCGANCAD
jgi:hypothetical protein